MESGPRGDERLGGGQLSLLPTTTPDLEGPACVLSCQVSVLGERELLSSNRQEALESFTRRLTVPGESSDCHAAELNCSSRRS